MKYFALLFIVILPICAFTQKVTGIITNQNGDRVQYATLYIVELQTGTSANHNGEYVLQLTPGTYTLDIRSMGYTPGKEKIVMETGTIKLDIELSRQSYILAGVTVRADNEDPAYSIMRKSIARAPGFVNQVESYTSEVYIKGSMKLDNLPKIIAKQINKDGVDIKEGQTYVNESINKITFEAPDTYNQEVISVNNSLPFGDGDVPVMGLISGSIYQSQDDFYISPFAANAFAHYKFEYAGLLQDGAHFINKIKVIPKRKSKLLMDGYLYIVDELWCLYSYDINLSPRFTKINFKQFYAPVKGNNYLPVNYFIEASFKAMGIRGSGTYTSTIKYSDVILNSQFTQKQMLADFNWMDTTSVDTVKIIVNPKVEEIDKKLEVLFENDNPSNREMMQMQKLMAKKSSILEDEGKENPLLIESNYNQVVSKDALVRDSMYWDSVRPVPASEDEKISYKEIVEKEQKEDSTSAFVKGLKIAGFGNYEWERTKKFYFFYPGLINLRNVGFNPVDGWQAMQSFKMRYRPDSLHYFRLHGKMGYAIDREVFFGNGILKFDLSPQNLGYLEIRGGMEARDFNNQTGTPQGVNAFYNVLSKLNYVNFYNDNYVNVWYRREISNGFRFHLSGNYHQMDSLSNSTNFSIYKPNDLYETNRPVNTEISDDNLKTQNLASIGFMLQYTPKQPFSMNEGWKRNRRSKYPTFQLNYLAALGIDNTYANFHKVDVSINHYIDFYSIANIEYRVQAGMFSKNPSLHFSSFQHFRTYQPLFTTQDFRHDGFYLLDNYEYSTSGKYLELHLKYSTQFLLLKRLPWVSNQFWTENIYFNSLLIENRDPYVEVGYSLGQILFAGEIGVFTALKNNEFYGVGLRAVFDFD